MFIADEAEWRYFRITPVFIPMTPFITFPPPFFQSLETLDVETIPITKYMTELYNESDESSGSESFEDASWISWFCSLKGNEFLCQVDEDYIQDPFNLTGLSALVPYYEQALGVVLDSDVPFEGCAEEQREMAENAAEMLYGLIHARFIVTTRGLQVMAEKYKEATFGRCPKVQCNGELMLPVGRHDLPRRFSVNVYCPRCQELYYPKSSRQGSMDGAYFGTTFPHLYLLTYHEFIPQKEEREKTQKYIPKVFGFKIYRESTYYAGISAIDSKSSQINKDTEKQNFQTKHSDDDSEQEQCEQQEPQNKSENKSKEKHKSTFFNPFAKRTSGYVH
jgi:casein kinase II subunit beta